MGIMDQQNGLQLRGAFEHASHVAIPMQLRSCMQLHACDYYMHTYSACIAWS